jgi:hypothetical protein
MKGKRQKMFQTEIKHTVFMKTIISFSISFAVLQADRINKSSLILWKNEQYFTHQWPQWKIFSIIFFVQYTLCLHVARVYKASQINLLAKELNA